MNKLIIDTIRNEITAEHKIDSIVSIEIDYNTFMWLLDNSSISIKIDVYNGYLISPFHSLVIAVERVTTLYSDRVTLGYIKAKYLIWIDTESTDRYMMRIVGSMDELELSYIKLYRNKQRKIDKIANQEFTDREIIEILAYSNMLMHKDMARCIGMCKHNGRYTVIDSNYRLKMTFETIKKAIEYGAKM